MEVAVLVLVGVSLFWFLRVYSSDTAGGSDSFGYLSEAVLLSQGHLSAPEHVLSPFGLPDNSDMTHSLGYAPRGAASVIPTYPFGYPLLLAGAMRLGGLAVAFWLTSLLGVGVVIVTYFLGRSQLGRFGGVLAATFVFLLPSFAWSALQPMSDVPATCFSSIALLALLTGRGNAKSAIVLAAAEGIGLWIRPNLVLLVVPTLAWLIWERDRQRLPWFCLTLVPFLGVAGSINHRLYGAVWATGYGEQTFATPAEAVQRAIRYLRRLQDQQAEIGLALVALGLALGRLPWSTKLVLLGVGAIFLLFFAFYPIDDAWSYARFLLPAFPAIAVVEAAGLVRLVKALPYRTIGIAAIGLVLAGLAWFSVDFDRANGVFQLRQFEQRYQLGARLVESHADRSALVLAMLHSGSLRFYSGLPTIRYDLAPLTDLLATLRQVQGHGGTVYLLADPAEFRDISQSDRAILLVRARKLGEVDVAFPGDTALYRVDVPPDPDNLPAQQRTRVTFGDEIALRGYDLSSATATPGADVTVTLYWEALRSPRYDYSVFIHVDDPDGRTVAQSDGYPVNGTFPMTRWAVGYAVTDVYNVVLPNSPWSGQLRVIAGLYRREALERLWPADAHGPLPDNFVPLGELTVAAP